ncbi:MAG TPA: guanine permease [Clostridiales bacterium]|nr:guanine permease [Clostridiales bacterium]
MEKRFHLKQNGTTTAREVVAGFTTFFAMAYAIFVIPSTLVLAGTPDNPLPYGGVFLAVILSSAAATLVMGLYANVPYALAPGIGLSSFLAFTVCGTLGFTWQEAFAMVFLCGLINLIITVTNIRKAILLAIPQELQIAIGGGIGVFIAYVGIKNAGFLTFTMSPGTYELLDGSAVGNGSAVPALATLGTPETLLAVAGFVLLTVFLLRKIRAGILLAILITTALSIVVGITNVSEMSFAQGITQSFTELKQTFLVAFGSKGLGSLFSDGDRMPTVIMTVFAFSLSDIFDTIGMFLGTGRQSGIFSDEEMKQLQTRDKKHPSGRTKLEKALFADACGTLTGSVLGCSNVTTYLESTAGIGAGGRTGLASVVTAGLFLSCIALSPLVALVPAQATAPVLIMVGIMMLSSFKKIDWADLSTAIPAFFAAIFMALCYNISYGIAMAFIFYCLTKVVLGQARDVSVVLWICSGLFLLNFVLLAL